MDEQNQNGSKLFEQIRQQFEQDDKAREQIITIARNILKPAKQAIYAIHRNDLKKAKMLLDTAKEAILEIKEIQEKNSHLEVGAYKAGLEEFIEAFAYYIFVTENRLFLPRDLSDIEIPYTIYLSGLCDFTGELSRRSISLATDMKREDITKIYEMVSALYEEFLKFDFRSGELRKKFEGMKYSLHKIEGIRYDLSFKQK